MSGSEDTTTNDTDARGVARGFTTKAALRHLTNPEGYEANIVITSRCTNVNDIPVELRFEDGHPPEARGVREDAEKLVKMAGLEVCHIRDDHKEPVTRIVAYALRRDREEREKTDAQIGDIVCRKCGNDITDQWRDWIEEARRVWESRDTLGAKLERLREHYEKNSHFKYNGWEWDKYNARLKRSHLTDTPDEAADKALEEMKNG